MSDEGTSKNSPVIRAAGVIKTAKEKFESMVRRTGAELVFEREARFALEMVQRSPQLQKADPQTIYNSLLSVSTLGLSLNPVLGEAALVPRWNKNKGMVDCTLSPMYRGLVRLATESGRVSHVKAELIFEDDKIEASFGTDPYIKHDPMGSMLAGPDARVIDFLDPGRNKLRGVYIIAHLSNGKMIPGIMSYEELKRVALCSEAFNPKKYPGKPQKKPSGPWVEHPGEMAKKSIINRDQKTWPRAVAGTDKLDHAIEVIKVADENEGYVSNVEPRTDEKPADVETISASQLKELRALARRQALPVAKICDNYKIEKLKELPASEFAGVKIKLEQRLQAYLAKREEGAEEKK